MVKKNILLVTNQINGKNGWSTVGANIYLYLQNDKVYNVDVIEYNHTNLKLKNILYNIYVSIFHIKNNKYYDLILCNVETLIINALLLKIRFKIKKMGMIGHGTYAIIPFIYLKYFYFRIVKKSLDFIIVPSEYTKNQVKKWYSGSIHKIKWGVNSKNINFKYYSKNNNNLLFIGELKERKGVEILLELFEKLSLKYEVKLNIVGKYNNHYKTLIKNHKYSNNIVLHGSVDDSQLDSIFKNTKINILPSVSKNNHFEGYGLVHLEANAYGIPTIGSYDCGNEEVIKDNLNGYLCNQNDIDSLYSKISLLLSDDILYKQISIKAFEFAAKNSWEMNLRSLNEIL